MPDYVEVIRAAFVDVWAIVLEFLPRLLLAVVVFLLGLLAAHFLKSAVERLIKVLRVDELVEKLEIKALLLQAGIKLNVGAFFGWIVKWFVIIFALIAAADVLEWEQVAIFLDKVVDYIPNVFVAVIILLVGMILGSFVQGIVRTSVEAAKMQSAEFVAGVAKWSIIVFSFMAALVQLGIAESLIQVLFTGFVAMLALAGGLAFGLGGKQHAARALDRLERDLSSRSE